MAENKLKAVVTADTSGFKKGMRETKAALADFKKQGGDAISGISSMLDGASGTMGTLARNIKNTSALFTKWLSDSKGGMSAMTAAIGGVGAALAGLGVTAVIAAFKELNQEAANFEQRLQGVNLAASASAFRNTYKQSLYDQTGRGEAAATRIEYWKTRLSGGWANMITGASVEQQNAALKAAERAAQLEDKRVEIQRELDQSIVSQAAMQARINELTNIARDNSKSLAEREEAKASATSLINIQYDKQISLQQRMADNLREMNSLVSSTDEEMRAQYAAEAAVHNLEAQRQSSMRMLIRMDNTLSKEAQKSAAAQTETKEATELTLEAATALVEKERELAALRKQNATMMSAARMRLDGALPEVSAITGPGASSMAITMPIKPVVDKQATEQAVVELTSVIEQGVVGMSSAIGELVGNLVNGEDAWQGFAKAGLDVVADMLATVGKAFIAEGVGVIAAQAALTTGGGAGAITAGAAMVALAATMKASMSNAASSWGGGYSSSVASSSYAASGAGGAAGLAREMTVRVTGTLVGNGSQLVAVLNNENDRRSHTT